MADPYWANVACLLHFDGSNGSTTITDETGKTWTAYGNAQLDTAQSQFGGASLLLDGTDDYVTTPDHASFALGSGDWTIECWIRENTQGPTRQIVGQHSVTGASDSAFILYSDSGVLTIALYVGSTTYSVTGSSAHSTGAWHHVAAVRDGGTIRLFLDGVAHGTGSISGSINDSAEIITIGSVMGSGAPAFSLFFDGWVEELRITNTVARYTTGFTPTGPFESGERTLNPAGLDATLWGTAEARLVDQWLNPAGLDATLWGTPEALLNEQWLSPAGIEPAAVGDPVITHWLQWIDAFGIAAGDVGDHAIGESPRTVSPPWWYSTVFGSPFVGEYLTLSPDGIGGAFGQASVLGLLQTIRPYGEVHSSAGTQFVELDDRHLTPQGYAQTLFGAYTMVPMLRTVLHSAGIPQNQGIGVASVVPMTLWPDGIRAGVAAERVTVSRSGDVLTPRGLDAGTVGRGMVSYFERTLPIEGLDAMYSSGWHHARNDARLLWPSGISGAAGTPSLRNELRTVNVVFAPAPGAVGTAWVDRAVRTIGFSEGLPPPLGALPTVQNWERYVSPTGYWQVTTGGLYVEAHQNRISPDRTVPSTLWGTAGVVNEDRQLSHIGGIDAGPRGHARVLRDPEYLTPASIPATLTGLAEVRDSTRTVRVAFAGAGGWIPETHWMRKELPDPPVNQIILDASVSGESFVSQPVVRTNWIYADGVASARYGNATVTVNGIRPRGIPPPGYETGGPVGVPSLPGTQYVFGSDRMFFGAYGTPRMTPHYIFGPKGMDGQYIDESLYGSDPARPKFGGAVVTLSNRDLPLPGLQATQWGTPEVQNQHRRLNLVGLKLFKPGFPNLRSGGDIEPDGLNATLWGDAVVAPPPSTGDQTVSPSGMVNSYGQHEVQNQHRALLPDGQDATLHGTQWVSHQYDPFPMVGMLATLMGEPLVEYLHRQVDAEGFDALDMTPFPGWSGDRMRVRPVSYMAVATAGVQGVAGTPAVELLHRTIGVGGIERPQIQVPEGARVRGELQIAPDGLGAGVIGGPRMWEPGDDLLPYAEDMLSLGAVRMIGVVQPGGFEALLMGDIRMALPVEPAGAVHTDWGAAVASHDGGGRICNSHYALAIAMAAMEPSSIGSHGVAHDP